MTNTEAIEILRSIRVYDIYPKSASEETKQALDLAIKALERPQGEWIIVKDERYGDNVKCPFCGKELAGTDLNFCCKCGAKNGIKAAGIKDIGQANEMADRLDQLTSTKVFNLSFETKEALRYAIETLRRGGTA